MSDVGPGFHEVGTSGSRRPGWTSDHGITMYEGASGPGEYPTAYCTFDSGQPDLECRAGVVPSKLQTFVGGLRQNFTE